jgi:prepilin-type N-terminal cleavage/methylation domain-containing protein
MRSKTKQKGFTLVELMMVVAILAILAGIATPGLLNAIPNMRLRSAARDIYSAMMQTKVEAIRRGENVSLLFNSPLPVGSPGGTYTMFLDNGDNDSNDDGVDDVVGGVANDQIRNGAELVLLTATLPDRVTYDPGLVVNAVAHADGVSFGGNTMIFTLRGVPVSPGGGLGMGTVGIRAVDANGNTQRQRTATVSSAGRIRIQ